MTSWKDVEGAAPDLAARAKALFDAHRHKTLASLRRDGSPRISGIEVTFQDGEMYVGMMPDSLKARDLLPPIPAWRCTAPATTPTTRTRAPGPATPRWPAAPSRSPTRPCWRASPRTPHRGPSTCSASTSPSSW